MVDTIIFKKECPEILQVSATDQRVKVLTDLIGEYTLPLRKDYFASLLRAIIGQQLSVKAAKSIWNRTVQTCDVFTPGAVLSLEEETLRNAGLSKQKIISIKDLSQKVASREIILAELGRLEDHRIVGCLTSVKGIGKWTAEMFLIFSLGRLDVWPLDDLGLRRAVKWLYGLNDLPGKDDMISLGEQWKPHRTVVALYLWEAINRGLDK